MMTNARRAIPKIVALLEMSKIPDGWSGIDAVLPLLERMRRDGCVVVVKLDGERTGAEDSGPYTVEVTGKPLGDEFLRMDHHELEDAIASVIVRYAERKWGYRSGADDA